MKKLLLLSSFCVAFFMIASCQNSKKSAVSAGAEQKSTETKTLTGKDTVTVHQTTSSGTAGGGKGQNKDSSAQSGSGKAIIHPVPNQEKIDSIKKSKTKKEN